jgi:gluconolactonase
VLTEEFEVSDARFANLAIGNVHVEKLWTGGRWTEGPAYFAAGRYLVWSDIPNDRLLRWDETDGSVSVFEAPCRNQNGHTVDREGRLVCCEHDGSRTVLAHEFDGKRLNSPNDVVVKSDGTVWFSDPTYGIDGDYEGDPAESEIGRSNVYRCDPATGEVTAVVTDLLKPNGLAFSVDETELYVADSGFTHDRSNTPKICAYPVAADGTSVGKGNLFAESPFGLYDGFRFDVHGNLWTSAGDGVHVFAPDATLIGKIRVPEVVSNVCFGGRKRNRLFITGTTSLYAVYVNTRGAFSQAR